VRQPTVPESLALAPIEQTIQVAFRYRVAFTEDLFSTTNPLLQEILAASDPARPARFLCVVEEAVAAQNVGLLNDVQNYAQHACEFLDLVAPPIVIPGGERVKTEPALVNAIHEAIHRAGLDRHSYVVVVGGGAVLDMVGYAAATAHRGVRLVRVPTTVLAQNDSGVGVKNGVNAFGKKNFLGTFAPPVAVLNDAKFFRTLPTREWRSGIAEAVKVALLKDPEFFAFIEEHTAALIDRDMPTMTRLIHRCAELHLDHIATSGDPFEFGSARPLDLGHWSAHKLEQLSDYSLRHGEAVSIGLALDSTYAHLRGMLAQESWRRILRVLSQVGLPLYARELSDFLHDRDHVRCVLQGLNEFREHLGGQLTIILPDRIGHGIEVHEIDEPTMIDSIGILESYPPV
jgi:3-dehydroquinate synthase